MLLRVCQKECVCWKWLLEMCGVVRGLIKDLSVALAKEVRIVVLADWIRRSSKSISSAR